MINPDLLRFIRSRQNEGMSRENITRLLVDEGDWTKEDIEEAFEVVVHDAASGDSESQSDSYLSSDQDSSQAQESPQDRENPYKEQPQKGIHTAHSKEGISATSDQGQQGTPGSPTPLIIVIVLFLLGVGGVGAAFFGGWLPFGASNKPPENLFERMVNAASELDSFAYALEASSSASVSEGLLSGAQPSQTGEGSSMVNFDSQLTINGAQDISNPDSPTGRLALNLSLTSTDENPLIMGASSLDLALETRTVGSTSYVKLLEAPDLGFFTLEPFKNQWIALEHSTAEEFDVSLEVAPENAEEFVSKARGVLADLERINSEHPVFDIAYQGTENIEGENSYNFQVELTDENLYDFLVAVQETWEGETEPLPSRSEFNEMVNLPDDLSGNVYIGSSNFLPTRLEFDTEIQNDEIDGVASFMLTFSAFNESVDVEEPEDARPFEEVLGEMFGGFGAGSSPMPGGNPNTLTPEN